MVVIRFGKKRKLPAIFTKAGMMFTDDRVAKDVLRERLSMAESAAREAIADHEGDELTDYARNLLDAIEFLRQQNYGDSDHITHTLAAYFVGRNSHFSMPQSAGIAGLAQFQCGSLQNRPSSR